MYVCICNAITDKQIRKAAKAGATNLWDLQAQLGVAAGCGSCREHAMEILTEDAASHVEPVIYTPALA